MHAISVDVPSGIATGPKLPLVSVIITAHNYVSYVAECLASVREQSYSNFECVVVDDASTDQTLEAVERTLAGWGDGRFSVKSTAQNVGQMGAQVFGLRATSGEFVVFVDADDVLHDNFLERHLFAHLNFEVPVAFTSSDQWTIDGRGTVLSFHHSDFLSRHLNDEGQEVTIGEGSKLAMQAFLLPWRHHDQVALGEWWWATQSTMMFRRPVLELILPETIATGAFRICANSYIVRFSQLIGGSLLLREALGRYRRHGGNNFSANPLIGARMQTGDMRIHPRFHDFHVLALATLTQGADRFTAVLGEGRFIELATIFRLGGGGGTVGRLRGSIVHRVVRRIVMRIAGAEAYAKLRMRVLRL